MNVYSAASSLHRFRKSWKSYVLQSTFAGLTSFFILLVLNLENAVVIAALGASAFIVFGRPFDLTARARNVIGGHMIGFVVGSVCALLPQSSTVMTLGWYALSVGLSIFLMVLFYLQHPPAAATALGVAMRGCSQEMLFAVVTITLGLAIAHYLLKPRLRNLF
jgi:CBS-domain-containing membrane protein